MMIPFTHLTLEGGCEKQLLCEHCRTQFSYQITRKVALDVPRVWPGLVDRGEQICHERLADRLADGVEIVPCPACGWIQADMSRELRRRWCGWLRTIGVYGIVSFVSLAVLCCAGPAYEVITHESRGEVEWLGMIVTLTAGALVSWLLVLARTAAAQMRYPATGFMPRHGRLAGQGGAPATVRGKAA
jgi:hypothetical protein